MFQYLIINNFINSTDSWINDERFIGWLQPVVQERDKAKCISCNTTFGSKKVTLFGIVNQITT